MDIRLGFTESFFSPNPIESFSPALTFLSDMITCCTKNPRWRWPKARLDVKMLAHKSAVDLWCLSSLMFSQPHLTVIATLFHSSRHRSFILKTQQWHSDDFITNRSHRENKLLSLLHHYVDVQRLHSFSNALTFMLHLVMHFPRS